MPTQNHSSPKPICVLGAGSWGTALAILLASNGIPTRLWGHNPEHLAALQQRRQNTHYLPNIDFPAALTIEPTLAASIATAQDLIIAVPSAGFRNLLMQLQPHLHASSRIAWATKGVENGTQKLLHEVANEVLQPVPPLAVISGPTFALEVAKGLPTAVTVAANDAATAEDFADYLRNPTFRTYTSTDMIGLQVGGAIKNVLAIAAGIADGLGFGANTRAALITRGVTELMRLGAKLGGQSETFMGLGGLGDLVLTCTDNLSRNRRYGIALGQGTPHKLALEEIGQVVEGYDTAREIYLLAKRLRVDMPICATTYQVLFEDLAPAQAVQQLLTRTPKAEFDPD